MMSLYAALVPWMTLFAQNSAYRQGQAIGSVMGLVFAVVIGIWAYNKFIGQD